MFCFASTFLANVSLNGVETFEENNFLTANPSLPRKRTCLKWSRKSSRRSWDLSSRTRERMMNDDKWWKMNGDDKCETWNPQLSKPPTFRFKTSLTNVSMVWLNRAGASNNNEETERITILCGIGSQDSDHFLGPFFWCRKKHPHQIHVTGRRKFK